MIRQFESVSSSSFSVWSFSKSRQTGSIDDAVFLSDELFWI